MPFLDRMFAWTMSLFVFITVVLPSGTVSGVNLKLPLYFLLLPLAVYRMFRRSLASPARVAMLLGVPALFACWVIVAVVYGYPLASSIRQYADVLMTMMMCWLASVYVADEETGRLRFLRLVLNAVVATAVFKIGLIAYALARGIPTVELVATISDVFGVQLMTMDLGALLGRIQFVSDGLIPAGIFIILRHRNRLRLGHLRAAASVLVLIISVVLSFSRYFWGFTVVAIVVGFLSSKRDRFRLVFGCVLGMAILASLPSLTILFNLRFSSEIAGGSDQFRSEQSYALKRFFNDAPLLGHGFGSYTTTVIRESEGKAIANYGYEEQLLALCGQIGMVGVGLLSLFVLFYYDDLWLPGSSVGDRVSIATLLLCWLASGLYNPLLFHPIAGINYATFAALAGLARGAQESSETNAADLSARLQPVRVPTGA